MRYPRSVQLRLVGGTARSVPMPKDEPTTFPRKEPARRKPGRKVPTHPRRPQGPGSRPAPSAPGSPPPKNPLNAKMQRLFRGMLRGYTGALYGGVFQGAYDTLQVFRTKDMILENGWVKSQFCRLDFNGYAVGPPYCGAQQADKASLHMTGSVNRNTTTYRTKAFQFNAYPNNPVNKDAYSFELALTLANPAPNVYPYTLTEVVRKFGPFVPKLVAFNAEKPSYETSVYPGLIPILGPAPMPAPWPLNVPRVRNEFTGNVVGPKPAPKPATANPLKPGTTTVLQPGVKPVTKPNFNHLPRPPGKRTKETKVRMGAAMTAVWHGIGTLTEIGDLATVLYENLPKRKLVELYRKLGRQPKPHEKLGWVYMHLNQLDIGGAMHDYIANEIEDRLYALGGKQMGKANRKFNRPIGFEAGGSLTGGGEYIATQTTLKPSWWPSVLPW